MDPQIFADPAPGSQNLADPNPGGQNLADPTDSDRDPKHWNKLIKKRRPKGTDIK